LNKRKKTLGEQLNKANLEVDKYQQLDKFKNFKICQGSVIGIILIN
jgi:hypothetical protein